MSEPLTGEPMATAVQVEYTRVAGKTWGPGCGRPTSHGPKAGPCGGGRETTPGNAGQPLILAVVEDEVGEQEEGQDDHEDNRDDGHGVDDAALELEVHVHHVVAGNHQGLHGHDGEDQP